MPNQSQHLNQWKRNRALLLLNVHDDYPEWKITVAFYCALHAVESMMAQRSLPRFKDHVGRNRFLCDPASRMLKIWHPYKALFDASHDARYTCPDIQKRFGSSVQKQLIQVCLQQVESAIMEAIGMDRSEIPVIEVELPSGRARVVGPKSKA